MEVCSWLPKDLNCTSDRELIQLRESVCPLERTNVDPLAHCHTSIRVALELIRPWHSLGCMDVPSSPRHFFAGVALRIFSYLEPSRAYSRFPRLKTENKRTAPGP